MRGVLMAGAGLSVAALAARPSILPAQGNPPAVTYESLMSLRFYPANGGTLVDGLWIVFPPAGETSAEFVIRKPDGTSVAAMPLRIRPTDNPAFARLESSGPPVTVEQPGEYVMAVRLGGRDITTMPYTLRVESGNDPFNPQKFYLREGPWNRTGYLAVRSDDESRLVSVVLWTSQQEGGTLGGPRQPVTVILKRGAAEVARGTSVVDWAGWQPIRVDLREARPNGHFLRLAALTDGAYTLEYRMGSRLVRTYPVRVQGGQVVRPARNQLGAEPSTLFVSPRIMGRVGGDDVMQEIFWLELP